jgi:hypothetical protein
MTPVFSAFDRSFYERIIPTHLADQLVYPSKIKSFLEAGGFTVHITGQQWRSVGLDEAHEMCVNKDMKAAITYPTENYLQKMSLYLNYRIKATKNLLKQLFPENTVLNSLHLSCIRDESAEQTKKLENIMNMIKTMEDNQLLPPNITKDRGLVNTFAGVAATPEQTHDLLNLF